MSLSPGASDHYWTEAPDALARALDCTLAGLSTSEAERRRAELHASGVISKSRRHAGRVLWRQFANPLLLLLVFAAVVAAGTAEWTEASIVLAIVIVTVGIGFIRELGAERAADALGARIVTRATVLRDGRAITVPREDIVPGDVVRLSAGSLVPADGVIIEASNLFVTESALTGESFPVEKQPGVTRADAPTTARTNVVFLGSNVRSGTATFLVARIGRFTELGGIAGHLQRPAPTTDFERGLRRFGYFVTVVMLMLVIIVFAAHVLRGRPPVETFLFSIALAVGLSPELMPAILTINLARGAQAMALRGVLVRRLSAIENLGSMDVLCTDKTGTLTEGIIQLEGGFDIEGRPSDAVRMDAVTNAALAAGTANPLDDAIVAAKGDWPGAAKLGDVPFDFSRRRVSVVVSDGEQARLISKGAVASILDVCMSTGGRPLDPATLAAVQSRVDAWSREGTRVVAIASRGIDKRDRYSVADETGLDLEGFVTFLDRLKPEASSAIADLARVNVRVKIITGDHHLVAAHVAGQVGLRLESALTGLQISAMDEVALWRAVESADVFAEVDPNQKERILRALRHNHHVVGFLGDGINDAPAMHVADTSLSVDTAADVARETADFVLLERDLDVIRAGIEEGRRTFANTLKYILMTMSANLGNMLSMATASLALSFLPMTASQILLNNLISDLPALGIANDHVDAEVLARPPRWSMKFIGAFMVEFGLLSSLFDVLTFALLLAVFRAGVPEFQTGWFVESLLTELVVALIVRTARPAWRSRPGSFLLWSTIGVLAVALVIPYLPGASWLGFVPLPLTVTLGLAAVTAAYAGAVEIFKSQFYRSRSWPHAAA